LFISLTNEQQSARVFYSPPEDPTKYAYGFAVARKNNDAEQIRYDVAMAHVSIKQELRPLSCVIAGLVIISCSVAFLSIPITLALISAIVLRGAYEWYTGRNFDNIKKRVEHDVSQINFDKPTKIVLA